MARGESGRIVIEVEPEMKRRLYAALALSGSTLKDWFLRSASDFCSEAGQLSLFSPAPTGAGSAVPLTKAKVDLEDDRGTKSKE